jgi:hypothetical protein
MKKRIEVTYDLLYMLLDEVKEHFQHSKAPVYLKRIVKKKCFPIFSICNYKKCNWYGIAVAVSKYAHDATKKKLKLRVKSHPHVWMKQNCYFLIIEINKGLLQYTRKGLKNLVAHEVAHIVQIVVDKHVDDQYSINDADIDHGKNWKRYCKYLGGIPEECFCVKQLTC